jgi:hypothetical protein
MEQAELVRLREMLDGEVRRRFGGAAIEKVELLQYGDSPEIEPGELLGRIVLALPEGADTTTKDARREAMDSFHDTHKEAIRELRKDLVDGREGPATLEITIAGQNADPHEKSPIFKMKMGGRAAGGDPSLTPVMARVGQEDLETLDTLIAVGIAGSRAEAVRWALARIRERPAYAQIRAHSREIEDLKSQF